ncbi:hypothetical protein HMPREF3092_04565 [Brevibacterium sp. HMSC24B04]|nr:hypothetical protein HMPREF3092_04565 [Brevibacterium sp. HMSC24B04]
MSGPCDHGVQDDGSPVDHCVLVIAGSQPAPLLDVVVATLDHVAVLVVEDIETNRTATARAPTFPMLFLIVGLRNDRFDRARPQMASDRA